MLVRRQLLKRLLERRISRLWQWNLTALVLSLLLLYAEPSLGRRSKATMKRWFWLSALLGVLLFYAPRHAPALLLSNKFLGWAVLQMLLAALGFTGIIWATADMLHLNHKLGFLWAAIPYGVLVVLPYPLLAHLMLSIAAGHGIVTLGSFVKT